MSQGAPAHGMAYIAPEAPSTFEVMKYYDEQARIRMQNMEAMAEQKKAHEQTLQSVLTKEWDDKEIDGMLRDDVKAKQLQYRDMIAKNPKMSVNDLYGLMGQDLVELQSMNEVVKRGRTMFKGQGTSLNKRGNINVDRAEQLATEKMLYKTDAAGNKVRKTAEEIKKEMDAGRNYYMEVLDEYPTELLMNKPQLSEYLKGATKSSISGTEKSTNSKGGSTLRDYDADTYSFQEVQVNDKTGEVRINTRGEVLKDKDGKPLVGEDKQPVMAVPMDVYSDFTANVDERMLLNDMFKAEKAKRPELKNIDGNSPEGVQVKRMLLYNYLSGEGVPRNLKYRNENKQAPAPRVTVTETVTADDDSPKTPKTTTNTIITGALAGSDYDKQLPAVGVKQADGKVKEYRNVLGALGDGYKVKHVTTGETVKPKSMLYDPTNRYAGYWVYYDKKNSNGEVVEEKFHVPYDKLKNWLLNSSRANTSSDNFTKSDEDVNRHFDKDKPVKTPFGTMVDKTKKKVVTITQ